MVSGRSRSVKERIFRGLCQLICCVAMLGCRKPVKDDSKEPDRGRAMARRDLGWREGRTENCPVSPVSVVVLNMLCTLRGAIETDVLGDGTTSAWSFDLWLPFVRMLGEISLSTMLTTCPGDISSNEVAARAR
jgi:hypothetical protein